jgi:hypothetical protein
MAGGLIMAHSIEKMKTKIALLLAKAERTDNEHERDAYNSQAERMMLRLGIEKAELEAAGEVLPEEVIEVTREWRGNYSIVMVPFVSDLAWGFGNITILQNVNHNGMLRRTFIIGLKSDVEEFVALVDSLALQVMSALKRWQRANRDDRQWLTDMEKYTQHRSFISGFGSAVRRRLSATRHEEEETASTGAALVLASKEERIQGYMDDAYPSLRKARGGIQTYSALAASAGHSAGQQASLGEKGIGGGRQALQG